MNKLDERKQLDMQIADRLSQVVANETQAEVSRRTQTAHPNIIRYLKGSKIPASFCGLLAKEFGVNPNWLLLGEGAMNSSDIIQDNSSMAGNVLELVQSMNTVARMRLGSLVGKDHLKVMRSLNDTLVKHEQLKSKLSEQTRSIFEELLNKLDQVKKNSASEQRELIAACKQIQRFCDDQELSLRLTQHKAVYEMNFGNVDKALEYNEQVLWQKLIKDRNVDEDFCTKAYNCIINFYNTSKIIESQRLTGAILSMLKGTKELEHWLHNLWIFYAVQSFEVGELEQALEILNKHYPLLPKEWQLHYRIARTNIHLASGLLPIAEAPHPTPIVQRAVARHMLLSDDDEAYKVVLEKIPTKLSEQSQADSVLRKVILGLIDFRNAPKAQTPSEEFKELFHKAFSGAGGPDIPAFQVLHSVNETSIYRLARKTQQAAKHCAQAHGLLQTFEKEYGPMLFTISALHASNILKLSEHSERIKDSEEFQWAQAYVSEYLDNGYRCLAHLEDYLSK